MTAPLSALVAPVTGDVPVFAKGPNAMNPATTTAPIATTAKTGVAEAGSGCGGNNSSGAEGCCPLPAIAFAALLSPLSIQR
jgi:hypothetical protein